MQSFITNLFHNNPSKFDAIAESIQERVASEISSYTICDLVIAVHGEAEHEAIMLEWLEELDASDDPVMYHQFRKSELVAQATRLLTDQELTEH